MENELGSSFYAGIVTGSVSSPSRTKLAERLLTAPSFVWMLVLFAWPAAHLFLLAFRPADVTGGVGQGWSTEAWTVFQQEGFIDIVVRTLWITVVVTLGCVLLAVPVAWRISRASVRWRSWLLLLVVLPFWTSFLIRVYAWRVLLQASGPLAVLPVYAAMEKFDPALLDAAHDLGATRVQSFFKVVLPSIRGGLVAAALLVGIPSLGSYVVPDMIGGVDAEMLGSKIGQRLFSDRNLPQAAALAAALALLAMPAVVMAVRRRPEEG